MLIQALLNMFGGIIALALVELIRRRWLIGFTLIISAVVGGIIGAWNNDIYLVVTAGALICMLLNVLTKFP